MAGDEVGATSVTWAALQRELAEEELEAQVQARATLERMKERTPEAWQLARLLSIAVRVEPELLREVRLALRPGFRVAAEADLWFSPITQGYDPRGFVLETAAVQVLRESLSWSIELEQVRRIIKRHHLDASAIVQLEERLTWTALTGRSDAILEAEPSEAGTAPIDGDAEIEAELWRVARGLQEGYTDLARWAVRALPRLPERVRKLKALWVIESAARQHLPALSPSPLIAVQRPEEGAARTAAQSKVGAMLPTNIPPISMYLRIQAGQLEVSDARTASGLDWHEIQVPRTVPRMVRVVQGSRPLGTRPPDTEPPATEPPATEPLGQWLELLPAERASVRLEPGVSTITVRNLWGEGWEVAAEGVWKHPVLEAIRSDDLVLLIDFGGELTAPGGLSWEDMQNLGLGRISRLVEPELGEQLRGLPLVRSAWISAVRMVRNLLETSGRDAGTHVHAFFSGPYPLAAWVGRCLERAIPQAALYAPQWNPDSVDWLPLVVPPEDHRPGPIEPFFAPLEETVHTVSGGPVVLSLEGRMHAAEGQLRSIADQMRAGAVYRLRSRIEGQEPGHGAGIAALREMEAALDYIQGLHGDAELHIFTSAPVGLVIGLGHLLGRREARAVTLWQFALELGRAAPAVEVMEGELPPAPVSDEDFRPVLEYLHRRYAYVELMGIRASGRQERVPVDRLYLDLDVVPLVSPSAVKNGHRERAAAIPERHIRVPVHQVPARSRRALLLGDPGSGKTMVLRYLTRLLAEALLNGNEAEREARTLLGLTSQEALPFPFFLSATAVDRLLERQDAKSGSSGPLSPMEFLREALEEMGLRPRIAQVRELAESGRLLLLLDGLDEVFGGLARKRVERLIEIMVAHYPAIRMLVTSRIIGVDSDSASLAGFDAYLLQPLTTAQAHRLIEPWFRSWEVDLEQQRHRVDAFLEALASHPALMRMAANPNVLVLLAVIYRAVGRLPTRRVDVYREVIDLFLYHKDAARGTDNAWSISPNRQLQLPERRALAARLALEMSQRGESGIPVPEARRVLAQQLQEQMDVTDERQARSLSEQLLQSLEQRSGLLHRDGESVRFSHQGYVEYLTAVALASTDHVTIWQVVSQHLEDPWFTEVLRMLPSIMGPDESAGRLIHQLSEAGGTDSQEDLRRRGRGLALAFGALDELGQSYVDRPLRKELQARLEAFVSQAGVPINARVETLEELGRAGDPRLGLEKQNRWVWLQPGTFFMGDDTASERERPQHQVQVKSGFWIARFPVTNHEYRAFLEAGGYRDRRWWSEEGWTWQHLNERAFADYFERLRQLYKLEPAQREDFRPRQQPVYWDEELLSAPNQPVLGINGYEAEAFCRWLNTVLLEHRIEWASGLEVRLPSEAEWEFAARGSGQRRYPWGDAPPPDAEHVNMRDVPAPVGAYPSGATPDGVQEMVGGGFEWCLDPWHPSYLGAPSDAQPWLTGGEEGLLTMRGGPVVEGTSTGQAAARFWGRISEAGYYLGFRPVLAAPIYGRTTSR